MPWRYCMAEPMSSSMGLATWCSVTVRLSFDVVVCVHFHLTRDLWTTYDTVVLILASTNTRWTRSDDIAAKIWEGNTASWFCRGHQLWVGVSVSFSSAIRGEGKWRRFNGCLAFRWWRRRFAADRFPPASFENCFASFISFSIPQSTHFKASRVMEHSFNLLNGELAKAWWLVMTPMQKVPLGYSHTQAKDSWNPKNYWYPLQTFSYSDSVADNLIFLSSSFSIIQSLQISSLEARKSLSKENRGAREQK